jgi:hypothetical protein
MRLSTAVFPIALAVAGVTALPNAPSNAQKPMKETVMEKRKSQARILPR